MIVNLYSNQQSYNKYRTNLNFQGTPAKFSQELKTYISGSVKTKQNEQNLLEIFKNTIRQFLNPENKVGAGEFGTVYKIDDEFVLKKPNNQELNIDSLSINDNPIVQKLKTYYGEAVAKIGNIKILKNAAETETPIPAGVKYGLTEYWQKLGYYRDVYLKKFTSLPQKAFDDVAADFKTLSTERKAFDTINPNNFLADGDKIKIIDDIELPNDKFFNSLAGMMKVFLTTFDRNTKAEFDVLAVGARRNLLRKIVLAGEKQELNFGSSAAEREELNEALRLCDIQTPWREVQTDLCNLRRRYPNIEERLKKVNEYIDELEDSGYNPFMD